MCVYMYVYIYIYIYILYIILYYIMLCNVMLCYIILYYVVVYCIILYVYNNNYYYIYIYIYIYIHIYIERERERERERDIVGRLALHTCIRTHIFARESRICSNFPQAHASAPRGRVSPPSSRASSCLPACSNPFLCHPSLLAFPFHSITFYCIPLAGRPFPFGTQS